MVNIFSVDVEDWFHPTEIAASLPSSEWPRLQSRVETPTRQILEMLAGHGIRGTFFILGWVAEHHPALVKEIAKAGHEIACHSYWHRLVYSLTPNEFREDTLRAVKAIEDACGVTPRAYRAPSYSITQKSMWAVEILAECGFTHDSSIYPVVHDRYGIPGFPRHRSRIDTPSGALTEVPPASVVLGGGRVAPVGGGGYLRLLPYRYTAAGLRRVNFDERQPACIYLHPWEIDPGQPRGAGGIIAYLRTYGGLRRMEAKVKRLLDDFEWGPLTEVVPAL